MNIEKHELVFHPHREGNMCGDATILQHWDQMIRCSDGRCVFGYGDTEAEAVAQAEDKLAAAETEIASSPLEQIKIIIARSKERIYGDDEQRLLRLFAQVLTT